VDIFGVPQCRQHLSSRFHRLSVAKRRSLLRKWPTSRRCPKPGSLQTKSIFPLASVDVGLALTLRFTASREIDA